MELFEKINRAFGGWYEGLFGGNDDVRPKDILRKILVELEENRKEGFDSKIYVPNRYVLEIAVDDEEERDYLIAFLDRDELETAIRRYCQQNQYHIRGSLDFTIKQVEGDPEGKRRDKVRVRSRYEAKPAPVEAAPAAASMSTARRGADEENPTVFAVGEAGGSEPGTVPAIAVARLSVETPGERPYEVPVTAATLTIGRSARGGNDIVLADDGMVSRRHARVEMDHDGLFTLYDLDTTNGTRVNGRKIDNRTLRDGDEIGIGTTRLIFRTADTGAGVAGPEPAAREPRPSESRPSEPLRGTFASRLVLLDGPAEVDDFILASDTLVGRGVTNHIVLADRSVSTRHARITQDRGWALEALTGDAKTSLNGVAVAVGAPVPLRNGDRVGIGDLTLRFDEGRA